MEKPRGREEERRGREGRRGAERNGARGVEDGKGLRAGAIPRVLQQTPVARSAAHSASAPLPLFPSSLLTALFFSTLLSRTRRCMIQRQILLATSPNDFMPRASGTPQLYVITIASLWSFLPLNIPLLVTRVPTDQPPCCVGGLCRRYSLPDSLTSLDHRLKSTLCCTFAASSKLD